MYKFGFLFHVNEMMDGVLHWVAEDLPNHLFWNVFLELLKLTTGTPPMEFQYAIRRLISGNHEDVLLQAFQICLNNNDANLTAVLHLLAKTDNITTDRMLIFLSRLLFTVCNTTFSSHVLSKKKFDCIISCVISYIEHKLKKPRSIISSHQCSKVLRNLSTFSTDVTHLRKIATIQASIIQYKQLTFYSIQGLSWDIIRKLISPSISYDVIKYFAEHTSSFIHPCIVADIVSEWWLHKKEECPSVNFIRTLVTRIQNCYSLWVDDVRNDAKFKRLIRMLDLVEPIVRHHLYYRSINIFELIRCVEGEGVIRKTLYYFNLQCTDNMAQHKATLPEFQYKSTRVPPSGGVSGHWYLRCYGHNHFYMYISFITQSQQEILDYLSCCTRADLHFVPFPLAESPF